MTKQKKRYRVLNGITRDEKGRRPAKRWEVGDTLREGDLSKAEIALLTKRNPPHLEEIEG